MSGGFARQPVPPGLVVDGPRGPRRAAPRACDPPHFHTVSGRLPSFIDGAFFHNFNCTAARPGARRRLLGDATLTPSTRGAPQNFTLGFVGTGAAGARVQAPRGRTSMQVRRGPAKGPLLAVVRRSGVRLFHTVDRGTPLTSDRASSDAIVRVRILQRRREAALGALGELDGVAEQVEPRERVASL